MQRGYDTLNYYIYINMLSIYENKNNKCKDIIATKTNRNGKIIMLAIVLPIELC